MCSVNKALLYLNAIFFIRWVSILSGRLFSNWELDAGSPKTVERWLFWERLCVSIESFRLYKQLNTKKHKTTQCNLGFQDSDHYLRVAVLCLWVLHVQRGQLQLDVSVRLTLRSILPQQICALLWPGAEGITSYMQPGHGQLIAETQRHTHWALKHT